MSWHKYPEEVPPERLQYHDNEYPIVHVTVMNRETGAVHTSSGFYKKGTWYDPTSSDYGSFGEPFDFLNAENVIAWQDPPEPYDPTNPTNEVISSMEAIKKQSSGEVV